MSHTCFHPAFDQAGIRFALGVDGGGTGTRARLWTKDGTPVGQGEAGPSGLSQGIEQAWRHVLLAAERAFASAGLAVAAPSTCAIGLGLAGAVAPHLAAAFFRAAPEFALIMLETDSRTALLGAHGGAPGMVISVGTGSVGEALHAGGRRVAVSGWGFPVGDEGSGAWLGLHAMRLAHRALDGRAATGALARTVWQRTSDRPEALLEWCASARQGDYAGLAQAVFDTAAHDPAAQALLDAAAEEVASMARALDADESLPLVLQGSVGLRLRPLLPPALRGRLVDPAGDAVDGAYRLVRQQLAEAVA